MPRAVFAVIGPLLVLGAFGAFNYVIAGDFRVTPWQGAYNLWAANRPGAHGRYFDEGEVQGRRRVADSAIAAGTA